MKVKLLIVLSVLLVLLIGVAVFWDPLIDALPIDQSGWESDESGYFYLDEDGDPVAGWQVIGGNRYYFDEIDGRMQTGLVTINDQTYQMSGAGVMQTGWVGGRYFLSDGPMALGWTGIDEKTYYFGDEGFPVTGWQEFAGTRFHFGEDGAMTTGWLEEDGCRYYLKEDGQMATGWVEVDGNTFYLDEQGIMQTGWVHTMEGSFCLGEDGLPLSGWQDLGGVRYYLNEDGSPYMGWLKEEEHTYYLTEKGTPYTGWLETDGKTFYMKDDGTLARGKAVIDGRTCYFTSTGAQIVLVNPWNYLPEDYTVELVELENGHKVAKEMEEALARMLADCEAAGHKPYLYSSYRTQSHQQRLFNNMVEKCGGNRTRAAKIVAIPGTSEHQLGYAVDITDFHFRTLNSDQEKTETQKWLMEHCWDYGFILRYPNDKSIITGIIYEPWHYRYVGLELAAEMKELGLCLEEYLDMLTGDGSTCGGETAE